MPKFPFAGLPRSQPVLSELLKARGYRCGAVGKWHLGLHELLRPNARGFKGDTFEGGIRVPFAIRWPGKIEPGTRYGHLVIQLDMVPTICAALGIDGPGRGFAFDGVDLLPYLTGDMGDARPHELLYWRRFWLFRSRASNCSRFSAPFLRKTPPRRKARMSCR